MVAVEIKAASFKAVDTLVDSEMVGEATGAGIKLAVMVKAVVLIIVVAVFMAVLVTLAEAEVVEVETCQR